MNELELKIRMKQHGLNLKGDSSIEEKGRALEKAIKIAIPPRDISDSTCIKRICAWIVAQIKAGRFNENEIFGRVLDYTIEATMPNVRKPAAVFVSIMKKELGYVPGAAANLRGNEGDSGSGW